jgi:hypothetical protein
VISKPGFKSIIDQINQGKEYPALAVIKKSPELATTISKLVKGREIRKVNPHDPNSFYNINQNSFTEISESIKDKIADADNTKNLFPDLELAAQILISSILSPKDMVNTDIIYRVTESIAGSELTAKLLETVEHTLEKHYKLSELLPDILREVLFETGSYALAVIPESSVDELINGPGPIAIESLAEIINTNKEVVSLGFLGNPTTKAKPSLESLISYNPNREPLIKYVTESTPDGLKELAFFNLEISDNFKLLKLPQIIATNHKHRIKAKIRQTTLAKESNITSREFENILYKGIQSKPMPFLSIKPQSQTQRKSLGRPLVLRLPSEATIPVFVPGNEKEHIGYFILIDEEGNPVSKMNNKTYMDEMQTQLTNSTGSLSSFLLQKAKRNLMNTDIRNLTVPQASQIYADIIEADLVERLKNGLYGRKVNLSRSNEIYRIMLARSLANQYTRLVYIPSELASYFALKYHDNGVGKSYLDDLKILTSLRAILLFSKVMALTKNSIAVTHVNMTLDPNDPDPQKTVELAVHEIIKMRQQYFPLGINSPIDLVDWIQRAGFEFTFEGHPGLPQTKFDFDTKNMQHAIPDTELEETLRKQTLMAIGLSPETVDNGFSSDFATTVIANNILLSKRVTQIQNQFTPQVTEHVKKILANDTYIRSECLTIINENKALVEKYLSDKDKEKFNNNVETGIVDFYEQFIETIEIGLPKPDVTTIHTQTEAFNEYADSLDKALESWINTEFLSSEVIGEVSGMMDVLKSTFKAFFLRKWMSENGFLPELADITSTDEDGNAAIDLYQVMKDHNEGLMRSAVKYVQSMKPMKTAADEDLEKLGAEIDAISGADSSSDSDYSSDDSGGDEFGMGGDDFGMGGDNMTDMDDTGTEDTEAEDTDNTEEEPV